MNSKAEVLVGLIWAISHMTRAVRAPPSSLLQKGAHSVEGGSEAKNGSRESVMFGSERVDNRIGLNVSWAPMESC